MSNAAVRHLTPSYKNWYRHAVTHTPAHNASQKQADTTRRRQLFKRTNTKGLLSLCTWGCPFARTARSRTMQGQTTMPHHPRVSPFAVGSSGILQGWPQGACTATHPTNGAGLSKAPQFTPRAALQATTNQHNQAIHKVNTPLRRVRQKKHSHSRSALHMLRHNN